MNTIVTAAMIHPVSPTRNIPAPPVNAGGEDSADGEVLGVVGAAAIDIVMGVTGAGDVFGVVTAVSVGA
jgi:hypothetical protein